MVNPLCLIVCPVFRDGLHEGRQLLYGLTCGVDRSGQTVTIGSLTRLAWYRGAALQCSLWHLFRCRCWNTLHWILVYMSTAFHSKHFLSRANASNKSLLTSAQKVCEAQAITVYKILIPLLGPPVVSYIYELNVQPTTRCDPRNTLDSSNIETLGLYKIPKLLESALPIIILRCWKNSK